MPKRHAPSQSTFRVHGRWSEEEARRALAALEESGLTIRAFAAQARLDPQRLARWRRRLAVVVEAPTFEEVTASVTRAALGGGGAASVERFEVVLPSGYVVRVPASFEASALRRLLSVVEEGEAC